MKKIIIILIGILLIFMSVKVFAATDNNEDFSYLTEEIVRNANDLFADKLPYEIGASDIDYANVSKIYVGTNIFEMSTSNMDELADLFGNDGYIYELPVYVGKNTILVNLSKGQALNESAEFTEAERQEILANEGRWEVTVLTYYEGERINYVSDLQKNVSEIPENIMLVGGLPYFKYAVALLGDESGSVCGLVPLHEVPGIETISDFRTATDNVYDYQKVKVYINQLSKKNSGERNSYGFPGTETNSWNYSFFIAVGVVLLCMVSSLYLYTKRKAR